MAFSMGSSRGPAAEINVTPLIDVLLVLLIIFMVMVPVMPHGLAALVPQPPKDKPPSAAPQPLVVEVQAVAGGGVRYALNQHELGREELQSSLKSVMAMRQDKVMFVKADRELDFSAVADVIGLAHQANAEHIGILTPAMEAGQ